MTGGAGGGGGAPVVGRGFARGAGGGAGGGEGGMIRGGVKFTTNVGEMSRRSSSSGDGKRISGSHLLRMAACTRADSTIATQIVGSIPAWRLV